MENYDQTFWSLLRAGLWGHDEDPADGDVSWKSIMQLSRRQGVIGLVAEGIAVQKAAGKLQSIPKEVQMEFLKKAVSIERSNESVNAELASKASLLADNGITAVQVKGQGLARNYLDPKRRTPGDIDFLMTGEDYHKAAALLSPLATKLDLEYPRIMHYGMFFGKVELELHGTLHAHLGRRYNRILDRMQEDMFSRKDFREYKEGDTTILIPSIDFDATFIFAHIVQHLYDFGLMLKQLCDWATFLHVNHENIDLDLLKSRLDELGIMDEWKALACLLSDKLGLPQDEIPFFDASFQSKAERLWNTIRYGSYDDKPFKNRLDKKFTHMSRRISLYGRIIRIFPANSLKSFFWIIIGGTQTFLEGK